MFADVFLGTIPISTIYLGGASVWKNTPELLNPYDAYLLTNDATLTGSWGNSSIKGYDDSNTMYSIGIGIFSAKWTFTDVSAESNFEIYVWIPKGGASDAKIYTYTITTGNIERTIILDLGKGNFTNKWYKLTDIEIITGEIVISLNSTLQNTRINAIRLTNIGISNKPEYIGGGTTQSIFINQSGYDIDKPKRATIPNTQDGEIFEIVDTKRVVKYTGKITNQIADFTNFRGDDDDTSYRIKYKDGISYKFKIKENYIEEVSLLPALRFMAESRQDTFNIGGNTGYGWRDSHQFSFELNSLVLQYMSNPTYYKNMDYKIHRVETCEYEELRVQNEPAIIWLIKFGALRYWDWAKNKGVKLHALIKGQLAYLLYLYPHITEYVSEEFYRKILETTIEQWGASECNKTWYEVNGMDNNLFLTQKVIGTVKGQLPPGYAIIPNLLMWEVAKRENLPNAQDYFEAFYSNCNWLVNDVNLDKPEYTKGQRMSEYITMTSLCQAYEMYPNLCPNGTYEKIKRVADVFISRSNNLWDLRQYSTIGDITNSLETVWTGGGTMNEPGNVAGFPAVCYAMARVLTDPNKVSRLKELAMSHLDSVFGRNPFGRHFGFDAPKEIEGVDLGWFTKYKGGYGDLGEVYGRIDGSPKESAYPYNPDADYGYTEGWVAFNTAWNMSLAYLCGENKNIRDGLGIFAK